MAGNVAFVDRNAKILAQYALGLATSITGVCFDGVYFWVTDTKVLYQFYQRNDGTFCAVQSFALATSIIPNCDALSCVDTDGYNLLVGYSGNDGGSPATQIKDVALISKSGVYLGSYSPGFLIGPTGGAWQDISFTGAHVFAMRTSGLVVPNNWNIRLVNPQGAVISQTQRNPYNSFAFDGLNFVATSNTNIFNILDWNRRLLYSSGVALGITTSCACCPNRDGSPSYDHRVNSTYVVFGYN